MKKLITLFVTAILSLSAWASPQVVQVVWPFSPGGTHAAMIRHLIDSTNHQQNKYQFVFVNKPGAGGTIAANYTSHAATLTVLASSSSFYSRPMMYRESHTADQFQLISGYCARVPMAMISRKYNKLSDLETQPSTIGIIPGSVTQLFSDTLTKRNSIYKFVNVPYKGTLEATTDMLGKHIDISVDFVNSSTLVRLTPDTTILGITGSRELPNMPTLEKQGLKGFRDLTVGYYMFVPATVDSVVAQELTQIFNAAINDAVRESCTNESGVVEIVTADKTKQLHQANIKQWRDLTQGIEKQ
jgi:tripartite-type tricarboxylate transporter receptor subunit TctC